MRPANQDLRRQVEDLWHELNELSDEIGAAISCALGLGANFLKTKSRKACSQMRFLQYPASGDNGPYGLLGAHTDYESFSLIVQERPGLEVLDATGAWHLVEQDAAAPCIILIGDMLEVFTNGQVQSCLHRVVPQPMPRHSVVYFSGLDYDSEVASDPSFGPAQVEGIKFGHHLGARIMENNEHPRERHRQGHLKVDVEYGAGNPFKNRRLARLGAVSDQRRGPDFR
jgi:isopenicillin N synthase-like dioxygenase